jgi:hypothetical protein
VYFPTLMLMPLYEDLHQRTHCVAPRSLQTAPTRGRWTRSYRAHARAALRARSAVSACTAGARSAGARS